MLNDNYSCDFKKVLLVNSVIFVCLLQIKYHEEFEKKKVGGEGQPSSPNPGSINSLIFSNYLCQ